MFLSRLSRTLFASLILATGGAALADAQWSAYTHSPAATLATPRGVQRLADAMEKEAGIHIRLHLGGSLPISTQNITQAVSDGVIQFGDDGFFQGNIPIGGLTRLPMLLTTPDEMATAVEIMKPYLTKAYAKKGIVYLAHYYYPIQSVWSRKPITSLADLRGAKMRVSSPEQGEFVRAFGGIPVTVQPPEVPSALERGVVDGVFTAAAGGGRIWKDLLKAQYGLGPNFFDGVLIVNKDVFDKLTPDAQAKLRQHAVEAAQWITEQLKSEEVEHSAKLAAGGITMTPAKAADREEGLKRLAPYWDAWAKSKGPDAVEALKKIRAAVKR
jgi:TRAP-type C4-dicarboxylate transport system substrate-binding protein